MSTSTQAVSSMQTYNSGNLVNQAVSAGAPSLPPSLVRLVTQYLFPEPQDWVTEWTGPHGYDVVYDAITRTEISLTGRTGSLVMQYLKKGDLFGLAEVEKAAGGERELRTLVFQQTNIGKFLFGEKKCNPQKSLPLEIDDEMQAPLSQHFNAEALKAFPNIQKVTELYSLYWCPAGITANNAEQLAKKHGTKFQCFFSYAHKEHGNSPTAADCWIAFPNRVFGRNKTVQEQEGLIPAGFEFPHVQDTIFCAFMKYACTGMRIMSDNPWTYTRCQEETRDYRLIVGGFGAGGLRVHVSIYGREHIGVAPVRTFC